MKSPGPCEFPPAPRQAFNSTINDSPDQQINSLLSNLAVFVKHADFLLPFKGNLPGFQLNTQSFLINAFQKARAKLAMHLYRRANDSASQFICFLVWFNQSFHGILTAKAQSLTAKASKTPSRIFHLVLSFRLCSVFILGVHGFVFLGGSFVLAVNRAAKG